MTWTPESLGWQPERPRLRPWRLIVAWLVATLSLLLAAAVLPG